MVRMYNEIIQTKNKIMQDFRKNKDSFYKILNNKYYDGIFNYNINQIEENHKSLQSLFEKTVNSYFILNNDEEFNQSNLNIFLENYDECIKFFNNQYREKEKFENHVTESISQNEYLLEKILDEMDDCVYASKYCDFKKMYLQQEALFAKALYDMYFMAYSIRIELIEEYLESYEEVIDELYKIAERIAHKYEKIYNKNKLIESDDTNLSSTETSTETNSYNKIFKYKDFEKILNQNGFENKRQTGSHRIYKKGSKTVVLPIHSKEMKKGISIAIQKRINEKYNKK